MAKSNVDVHQLAKDVKVELNLLRDEVLKYEVDAQLARKEVVAVSHKIKTLEDVNAIKEVEERKKKLEVIVKKVEKDLEWKSNILLQKEGNNDPLTNKETRNKKVYEVNMVACSRYLKNLNIAGVIYAKITTFFYFI